MIDSVVKREELGVIAEGIARCEKRITKSELDLGRDKEIEGAKSRIREEKHKRDELDKDDPTPYCVLRGGSTYPFFVNPVLAPMGAAAIAVGFGPIAGVASLALAAINVYEHPLGSDLKVSSKPPDSAVQGGGAEHADAQGRLTLKRLKQERLNQWLNFWFMSKKVKFVYPTAAGVKYVACILETEKQGVLVVTSMGGAGSSDFSATFCANPFQKSVVSIRFLAKKREIPVNAKAIEEIDRLLPELQSKLRDLNTLVAAAKSDSLDAQKQKTKYESRRDTINEELGKHAGLYKLIYQYYMLRGADNKEVRQLCESSKPKLMRPQLSRESILAHVDVEGESVEANAVAALVGGSC